MLDINQNTQNLLAFVAEYAQLTASEEELAACKILLDSIVTPVRMAPNNALEAIEPVTTFHLPTVEAQVTTSSPDARLEIETTSSSPSKLGEISTDFEVKRTKSARKVEIDHPEPGETAPHLASSIDTLYIIRH